MQADLPELTLDEPESAAGAVIQAELGYHICTTAALGSVLKDLLQGETYDAWLEDPGLQIDPYGLQLREAVARSEALDLPALWPEGRIFNAVVDLRWEHRPDGQLHLVAIADRLPSAFRTPELLSLTLVERPEANGTPEHLLLWGERRSASDEWGEGRIPNLKVHYPDWKGRWAAIEARTYETEWVYDSAMPPTVRTVTRYVRFVGNYKAPIDQRFT